MALVCLAATQAPCTSRVLRTSWCGAVRLAPSFLQPPAGSPQMMAPQIMSPPCQVSVLVGMGARLHLQLHDCMKLCPSPVLGTT